SVIDSRTGDTWTYQKGAGVPATLPVDRGGMTEAQFAAWPTDPVALRAVLLKQGRQQRAKAIRAEQAQPDKLPKSLRKKRGKLSFGPPPAADSDVFENPASAGVNEMTFTRPADGNGSTATQASDVFLSTTWTDTFPGNPYTGLSRPTWGPARRRAGAGPQLVSQRQSYAVAQFLSGHRVLWAEADLPVAGELEQAGIEQAEALDQARLAGHVHAVGIRPRPVPAQPDRHPGPGRGQVARLPPAQGLGQLAGPGRAPGHGEDERPDLQQPDLDGAGVAGEDRSDLVISDLAAHVNCRQLRLTAASVVCTMKVSDSVK
ncbi:MAG: hypothetical protein ABJB47_19380, partial [Actinomycetota bacterium]